VTTTSDGSGRRPSTTGKADVWSWVLLYEMLTGDTRWDKLQRLRSGREGGLAALPDGAEPFFTPLLRLMLTASP